jgi:hypothetical protein
MAKLRITIGFATSIERKPGVFVEEIVEKPYTGDLFKNTMTNTSGQSVNPNLSLSNKFSMLVDDFSKQNHSKIRYAVLWGCKWNVSNMEIQEKRLVLIIGSKYHE